MRGGSARRSPTPCVRCRGDASDRCAVTGEALHPLRTLPHPAPPPWLHDQIIAAVASEARRRRWLPLQWSGTRAHAVIRRVVAIGGRRAGNPLKGKGGNDVGRTARTG